MAVSSRVDVRSIVAKMKVPDGQIVLWSQEAQLAFAIRLDDGYPAVEGLGGGWEDVARPGQVAATVYRGRPSAPVLRLDLILGWWPQTPSLVAHPAEKQMDYLERLALPRRHGRGERPPLLKVKGNVRHGGAQWFISEPIAYSEGVVDRPPRIGRRRRPPSAVQQIKATVVLRRFVPIRFAKVGNARRDDSPDGFRRYRVKRGETASKIAQVQCGASGSREVNATVKRFKWGEGKRRGERVRDPRRIRAGDWLLIPIGPAKWGRGSAGGLGAVIA